MQGLCPVFMEAITMITQDKKEMFYGNAALASNSKLMAMSDVLLNGLSNISCDCHKAVFSGGNFEKPATAYKIEINNKGWVTAHICIGNSLNVDYIVTEREEANRSRFFHSLDCSFVTKYDLKHRTEWRNFIKYNQEEIYSCYLGVCQQVQEFRNIVLEMQQDKSGKLL